MNRSSVLKFAISFFLLLISISPAESYWQQFVHYTMDIELDTAKQDVKGISSIIYVNNSPDHLDRVYMHLYPNAFQEGSVKYREFNEKYGRLGRIASMLVDISPYESNIEVHLFQLTGKSGSKSTQFKIDDTILSADLPELLAPGDSLIIQMDWTHHTGEMIERAGRIGDQYNMAQWYPKLVVYDEKGWHADPFHAEGEFYGEFGTFDVTLDVPKGYVVGATGLVTEGDPGWDEVTVDTSIVFSELLETYQASKTEPDADERRVVSFHAEQVHDFAWIASDNFLYEHGEWNGIDIHVLYNESNGEDWAKVVLERSVRALGWLSERFGTYAYPQVSVTDRPRGGGMEYPMLVMNGSNREGLIVHEIGHIWFYGILGNNEVDESWLDEGFASFVTRWYKEDTYPPSGLDMSLDYYKPYQRKYWKYIPRTDSDHWSVIRFNDSGKDEPVSRSSYLFNSGSVYRFNAYTKPSLMLRELRYVLGDSLFIQAMHTYFDRWKFKHVNEERFISTMEEVSGKELDWFFDPWLHNTPRFDAAISDWSYEKAEDGNWEISVELEQKGNRFLPLDIQTTLKDGRVFTNRWNNHLWRFEDTFTYIVPGKPKKLMIDPEKFTLDADRRNNQTGRMKTERMLRRPGMKYTPIDAYVVEFSPLLYYHETDGYTPGINLTRKYGYYEATDLRLTVGTKSDNIGWNIQGRSRAVNFKFFNENGISGNSISFKKSFSKKYNVDPIHKFELGYYSIHAEQDARTNLYDTGRVTAGFISHSIPMNHNLLLTNFTTTMGGVSDWDFSRLTSEVRLSANTHIIGVANRLLVGVSWEGNKGVPAQERFTIEGAGSGDCFNKSYLRDESSFFGFADERSHYHLPGDANLRGYYNQGYVGAESLITNSLDLSIAAPIPWISLNFTAFVDAALLWGSKWEQGDNGFDGDALADAGVGFRVEKNLVGYPFTLRVEFPIWLSEPGLDNDTIDPNRWIFSFQKGF